MKNAPKWAKDLLPKITVPDARPLDGTNGWFAFLPLLSMQRYQRHLRDQAEAAEQQASGAVAESDAAA